MLTVFGTVFFMLAEELFNKTPEWLTAILLLQQLYSGVHVGEIFHGDAR